MDDLEQILGIKYTPEQQAALSEMQRRANDTFRVYNPTDQDYFVEWDIHGAGGRFLVPAATRDIGYSLGQAVHPRYITFKFFKEISNKILAAEMMLRVREENEARSQRGAKAMDKSFETGEELAFIQVNQLLPNNQDKLMELLPKIILGVEKEWGMDSIPYQKTEDRVNWDKVMAIVNRPASQNVQQTPDIQPEPKIEAKPVPEASDEDPLANIVT